VSDDHPHLNVNWLREAADSAFQRLEAIPVEHRSPGVVALLDAHRARLEAEAQQSTAVDDNVLPFDPTKRKPR
jgi:hypothetical protein